MDLLTFIVNPCPILPAVNPPALVLAVSCAARPSFIAFTAIPSPITASGPTSLTALALNCLVQTGDYGELCNNLRNGQSIQILIYYDNNNGYISVRQVKSSVVGTIQQSLLLDIKHTGEAVQASTQRIEHAVAVDVVGELHAVKAQLTEVLTRLPSSTASTGGEGAEPQPPISHFPNPEHASGEEDPEQVLYGSGKAS